MVQWREPYSLYLLFPKRPAQHSSLAGLPSASQSSSRTCRRLAFACLIKLDKLRKIRDGLF